MVRMKEAVMGTVLLRPRVWARAELRAMATA